MGQLVSSECYVVRVFGFFFPRPGQPELKSREIETRNFRIPGKMFMAMGHTMGMRLLMDVERPSLAGVYPQTGFENRVDKPGIPWGHMHDWRHSKVEKKRP